MIRKLMAGLLVCTAFLTGCATTVQKASREMDKQAKTFSVKPEKANIYVYRNFLIFGGQAIDVELDGKLVGETYGLTYMVFEVDPGKHTLISKVDNECVLELEAEAGKNYFAQQLIFPGFLKGTTKCHFVEDADGKAGVSECELYELKAAK